MKKAIETLYLAGVALAVVAVSAPAQAQDVPAGDEAEGDTIVVTARKRAENLIDVPLPVTVATQAQLERDQIYNVNDLQRIAPALEISQTSGGETNGGGRLRGVGTGVFNPSVASSVALVIDQVPVGNLNFPLLYDLGQIEVLRGPQGTLFGQGASAGVLNVSTRNASFDEVAVNASIDVADKGSLGSEVGEIVFNTGVNIPLAPTSALRVAMQYKKETGVQRSATTGKDNKITDLGIRGKLRMEPTDDLSVNISAEYGQERSNGQNFFAIAIAPNATTPFGPPGGTLGGISTGAYLSPAGCNMPVINERAEFYCEAAPTELDVKFFSASARIDYDVSDTLSLHSITGFRVKRFDQISRDFSRILPQPAARQERTREDADQLSQEFRASYTGEGFDLVAGLFYNEYTFDRKPLATPLTLGSNAPGSRIGFSVCAFDGSFCPVPTSLTDENTHNRVYAVFADATVKLAEQVELFGGIRFDDYKNTTAVQVRRAVAGPIALFTTKDSNISGRAGISFKPDSDTNIFASYSRGYKPPAVGTNVAGSLFQLAPEKADAFEIGIKRGIGRVQLSANAFYTTLKNFQSQRSEFAGTALISVPFNVSKLKSKGFEVNAFGQVARGFNINAGYQFNELKYPAGVFGDDAVDRNGDRIFDDNVVAGLPFSLDGTQFLNAPKHKFTISGDYGFAVGEGVEVFLNANLIYKSKVLLANRADPRYRYPGHEIVNGAIGIRDPEGDWNASIFVRNLTKEREPTAYLASTFAGQADGGIRAWPVAGFTARVLGVRAGFNF